MAFWFFLSTRFGIPVCELKWRMPYAEFVHHLAYYRMHPWGDDWAQAGMIGWSSAQPHIRRRMKPQDFMPKPRKTEKPQTPDYIFGVFKQMALDAEARRNGS